MLSKNFSLIAVPTRRIAWRFSSQSANDWFDGNELLTAMMNVYTLLVPDNEKYYIRSMKPHVERLQSDAQRSEVLEFFRQESLHGVAHRKYWEILSESCRGSMAFAKAAELLLYRILEPLQPSWLRLSIVAAIEHINACIAHDYLSKNRMSSAESTLRDLFEWHFAEEIEHKSVAHDFLYALYPGYIRRVAGALVAYPTFYALLGLGTLHLLIANGQCSFRRTPRLVWNHLVREGAFIRTVKHFATYLSRSFQPWGHDNRHLAATILALHRAEPAQFTRSSGNSPAISNPATRAIS